MDYKSCSYKIEVTLTIDNHIEQFKLKYILLLLVVYIATCALHSISGLPFRPGDEGSYQGISTTADHTIAPSEVPAKSCEGQD